jgi:hypothetical protein
MARHNRVARGSDQRGETYELSYQPDWLRLVKVTRTLESGRQSTKTLFKNRRSGSRRRASGPHAGRRAREQRSSSRSSWTIRRASSGASSWRRRRRASRRERLVFSIDGQRPQKRRGS